MSTLRSSASAGVALTKFLYVGGGEIAYDVSGEGPLVALSHGMGDVRRAYRFLAPRLILAGYRVAVVDMRGHGESNIGWTSITRTDVGRDLLALITRLGGPAVIVGHSLPGGAAAVAAALESKIVRGIIGINPFTRVQRAGAIKAATLPDAGSIRGP
jgi:pimeloyl-ACP methyl ester carboxylesterase